MVAGTNNCPFCDEEVYCIGSCECVCSGNSLSHWPFYEQFKCPHCGIFNICIDRRFEPMQNRLRCLQAIAAEENIEANQNEKYVFWLDRPPEQAVCSPEIKQAIKKGQWVVKQIQEYE
jgi:hypothetical protein